MGNAHRAVVEVLHHSHDEPMPGPRWLPRWGAVLKVLEPEMSQVLRKRWGGSIVMGLPPKMVGL